MKAVVFLELVLLILEKIQRLFKSFRETFQLHIDLSFIHFFERLFKEENFLVDDGSDVLKFLLNLKRQSNGVVFLFLLFLLFQYQNTFFDILESVLDMR